MTPGLFVKVACVTLLLTFSSQNILAQGAPVAPANLPTIQEFLKPKSSKPNGLPPSVGIELPRYDPVPPPPSPPPLPPKNPDFDYEDHAEEPLPEEDHNHDGTITQKEVLSYWNSLYDRAIREHNPGRYIESLFNMDSDQNGTVTRREVLAHHIDEFNAQDTNRDGLLTQKEREKYFQDFINATQCGLPIMALEAKQKDRTHP